MSSKDAATKYMAPTPISLFEFIYERILEHQKPHIDALISILLDTGRALDLSDTGTGKTYTAIATCLLLGLKPFIICPKSVIYSWMDVAKMFNAPIYGVTNFETLHNCKYYNADQKKIYCPFIEIAVIDKTSSVGIKSKKKIFVWKDLPSDAIFIVDESHKCKNTTTLNYRIVKSLSSTNAKILLLSATLADTIKAFKLPGFLLGLYGSMKEYKTWLHRIAGQNNDPIPFIHKLIFPQHAARMCIKNLANLFKENIIHNDCYDMNNAKEIQEMYDLIEEEVALLKHKEDNSGSVLAQITYARMGIEQLKIPTLIKLARKHHDEGNSVAIFVNYTSTLEKLCEELGTDCKIYGEQSLEERSQHIQDFQKDVKRIIVCNIRSGGVGISLHDTHGLYPRVSLISPSYSAQDIIQVLGRIHRANGKTRVNQYLLYCKDTIEEKICEAMEDKIKNICILNDGYDSRPTKIVNNNVIPPIVIDSKIYQELMNKRKCFVNQIDNIRNDVRAIDQIINVMIKNARSGKGELID